MRRTQSCPHPIAGDVLRRATGLDCILLQSSNLLPPTFLFPHSLLSSPSSSSSLCLLCSSNLPSHPYGHNVLCSRDDRRTVILGLSGAILLWAVYNYSIKHEVVKINRTYVPSLFLFSLAVDLCISLFCIYRFLYLFLSLRPSVCLSDFSPARTGNNRNVYFFLLSPLLSRVLLLSQLGTNLVYVLTI